MYISYIYNQIVDIDLSDLIGFDWDTGNSGRNDIGHEVTDAECEEIFFNAPLLLGEDPKHSEIERRFGAFGVTNAERPLTVVFTVRRNLIRIISARDMNRKEREFYKTYEKNPEI